MQGYEDKSDMHVLMTQQVVPCMSTDACTWALPEGKQVITNMAAKVQLMPSAEFLDSISRSVSRSVSPIVSSSTLHYRHWKAAGGSGSFRCMAYPIGPIVYVQNSARRVGHALVPPLIVHPGRTILPEVRSESTKVRKNSLVEYRTR